MCIYWSNKRSEGEITKNEVCVISHSIKVPCRILWGGGGGGGVIFNGFVI